MPFLKTIVTVLVMRGLSLNRELLRIFEFSTTVPTASAFVQQRDKILPAAFEYLFREFTDSLPTPKGLYGYHVYAADGSDINIPRNPKDGSTYMQNGENTKGYNLLHLNALYDLRNKLYIDYIVQPRLEENETKSLAQMISRSKSTGPSIVLCDRGYESYNTIVHLGKCGWKFAIRVKDIASTGILSGFKLPDSEFDVEISTILTRKNTNKVKKNPDIYKCLSSKTTFEHFDADGFCHVSFRVVRFKLKTGEYETVITNLDKVEFPPDKIKELYNMRWGIETSFRELKYTIGLSALHAKKEDSILQEIAASIIMYNFCEALTYSVVILRKNRKYDYKVNFTLRSISALLILYIEATNRLMLKR